MIIYFSFPNSGMKCFLQSTVKQMKTPDILTPGSNDNLEERKIQNRPILYLSGDNFFQEYPSVLHHFERIVMVLDEKRTNIL